MRETTRRFAPGDRLPEETFRITQEKIDRYSRYALGRDAANIHTDDGKARRAGLPGRVAHGRHPIGYISEAMLRAFGEAWLREGELDVTLRKLIFPGDTLTLKAEVTGASLEKGAWRITLDVALVNQHGEPVQSGQAGVRIPAAAEAAR